MPVIGFPSLHIRPFLSGSDTKTSISAPLGVAKCLKIPPVSANFSSSLNAGAIARQHENIDVLAVGSKIPDKIASIHSKLVADAEKIQKWKISVEFEQQLKDKKLKEAYQTNDSLRKELLDLQLQNETLSLQLDEELQNRNEILQKQQSTRELCVALKKHFAGLQEKTEYLHLIKENSEMIGNQREETFKDLAQKFNALQITHMEQVQTFNNIVSAGEREMNAMREAFENQIDEANKQLEYLNEVKVSKEKDIAKICSELKEKEMLYNNIASEEKQHLAQISNLKEINSILGSQVKEAADKISVLQAEKSELIGRYKSCEAHATELQHLNAALTDEYMKHKKEHEAKIGSLEVNLKDTKSELCDEKQNVEKQQAVITDYESVVQSLRDEKGALEKQITTLEKYVQNGMQLQEEIERLEEKLVCVGKEKNDINSTLSQMKIDFSDKESQCESLLTEISCKETEAFKLRAEIDELRQMTVMLEQKEEKINEYKEELGVILKERDDLVADIENNKALLLEKQSLCDSLQTEVNEKEKNISNLLAQIDEFQLQIKSISVEEQRVKIKALKLEEQLKCFLKEKEDLSKEFQQIKSLLSEKESLCESLSTKVEEHKKDISDLIADHENLQAQIEEYSAVEDVSFREQQELRDKLKISENRRVEQGSMISKLENLLVQKEKELATAAENEAKLSKLSDEKECTEQSYITLQEKLATLEEDLKTKKSFQQEKSDAIKKLESLLKMKEKIIRGLESQVSKLDNKLSSEQTKRHLFSSSLEQEKQKIKELHLKIESHQRSEEALKAENSNLKSSLSEEQMEKKSISEMLEKEVEKLEALKTEVMGKENKAALLESQVFSLEEKVNELIKADTNQKELHASQIKMLTSRNEKSQELILLHERSLKEYREDCVEKEQELQCLQNKIQKLENELRFGRNKEADVEKLKAENAKLKSVMENWKVEFENKKNNIQKVSDESAPEQQQSDLKIAEDQDSSSSMEIDLQKLGSLRSTKLTLPQKRIGVGKPINASSANVTPCRRDMRKPVALANESEHKKLRLANDTKQLKNASDFQNPEGRRKTVSGRKFFKSSHIPQRNASPDLSWFDMNGTYAFCE